MIIKWHDAKKELPKESGSYLCFLDSLKTSDLSFSKKHKIFNANDEYCEDFAKFLSINVLFWAEKITQEDFKNEIMA